jgi:threonine dehydratase
MAQQQFLEKVLTARVYDVARETSLDYMNRISSRNGNKIWLKREDLQPVFSFKIRGAFNKIYLMLKANPGLSGHYRNASNHARHQSICSKKPWC